MSNELKYAGIVPAHKKKSELSHENYRPIRILLNIPNIYERCLFDQIATYFEKIFSKYWCGFRKSCTAQYFLRTMTGKWKKNIDYWGVFAALLTDLSKAFDYVSHELIIAKLQAYGFHIDALEIVHDYLSNRTKTVKVNNVYSFWKDIFYGVPLGSTLVPLLFDIYDLFYFFENLNIESYADDTTINIDNETKE